MLTALILTAAIASPATLHDTSPARAWRPAAVARPHATDASDAATAATTGAVTDANGREVRLAQSATTPDTTAPGYEPTFVEKYLAFQLSPNASKQVKDGQVLGIVLGYVCLGVCGPLWGPVVATKDAEFSGDVAVTWFLSSIIWGLIASAASLTGIGGLLWLAVPYLTTVATMNEIDRGIRKKQGPAQGAVPNPTPPTPGGEDTPPPAYAY
jgi:hypothetical protein